MGGQEPKVDELRRDPERLCKDEGGQELGPELLQGVLQGPALQQVQEGVEGSVQGHRQHGQVQGYLGVSADVYIVT